MSPIGSRRLRDHGDGARGVGHADRRRAPAAARELAFGTIPTRHYGANSAWQQLVALAHNLLTNFQIETGAPRRPRSAKRTAVHVLKSIHTLRFELFHRAGRLVRPDGISILRMAPNEPTKQLFLRMAEALGGVRAA